MNNKSPTTYILASQRNGTLYIGVTATLIQRTFVHRERTATSSFAARHAVARLVYFEQHVSMRDAILREKQLKRWRRAWKIRLIELSNPDWRDLWLDLL